MRNPRSWLFSMPDLAQSRHCFPVAVVVASSTPEGWNDRVFPNRPPLPENGVATATLVMVVVRQDHPEAGAAGVIAMLGGEEPVGLHLRVAVEPLPRVLLPPPPVVVTATALAGSWFRRRPGPGFSVGAPRVFWRPFPFVVSFGSRASDRACAEIPD